MRRYTSAPWLGLSLRHPERSLPVGLPLGAQEQRGLGTFEVAAVRHDAAHPAEFLVQLAALHARVFLALVMGEDAVADVSPEPPCRDKHAALHRKLRQANTSDEGRLTALAGSCDHHQCLAVGVEIIGDCGPAGEEGREKEWF